MVKGPAPALIRFSQETARVSGGLSFLHFRAHSSGKAHGLASLAHDLNKQAKLSNDAYCRIAGIFSVERKICRILFSYKYKAGFHSFGRG